MLLPRHRAVHVTPTVAKASAGAVEHVPIALVPGLPATLSRLRDAGIWVVGLDDAADRTLFDIGDLAAEGICLVLGAEGAGLSRLVRERCDVLVAHPDARPDQLAQRLRRRRPRDLRGRPPPDVKIKPRWPACHRPRPVVRYRGPVARDLDHRRRCVAAAFGPFAALPMGRSERPAARIGGFQNLLRAGPTAAAGSAKCDHSTGHGFPAGPVSLAPDAVAVTVEAVGVAPDDVDASAVGGAVARAAGAVDVGVDRHAPGVVRIAGAAVGRCGSAGTGACRAPRPTTSTRKSATTCASSGSKLVIRRSSNPSHRRQRPEGRYLTTVVVRPG